VASLLIRGGYVATLDDERRELDGGWVAVRDGAIEAVGPAGDEPGGFDEDFDASGCVVTPGLVNAHQHLWYTLFRGLGEGMALEEWLPNLLFTLGPKIDRETHELATRLACLEMLATGTTSSLYHLVTRSSLADCEALTRAARETGFRLAVAKELRAGDDFGEVRACLDALDAPALVVETAPHWLARATTTDDLVLRAHELARERDLKISDHVATGRRDLYANWVRETGRTDVEYLEQQGVLDDHWLLVHAIWLDDADVERIARSGAWVVPTPTSQAARGGGITRTADVLRAGGRAALGTDGPMVDLSVDMLEQAKALAAEGRQQLHDASVLDARTVLELSTRAAADAIGLGGVVGTLEPGKRADVAVFDLRRPHVGVVHDPIVSLVGTARGADATLVLVDGEPARLDRYAAVHAEARERALYLAASA
jgi:5-methylthioadenosine/S-adenosylhomocysteine deaminase